MVVRKPTSKNSGWTSRVHSSNYQVDNIVLRCYGLTISWASPGLRFHHQLPGGFHYQTHECLRLPVTGCIAILWCQIRLASEMFNRRNSQPTTGTNYGTKCPEASEGFVSGRSSMQYVYMYIYIYVCYMYTPSNGHYQDHYIFSSGFLWWGSNPICNWIFQVCKEKCGFIQTKAYQKSQTLQECPSWKETSHLKTYGWKTILSSHNFINLMLGMAFQNPYQRFYFHLLLWSEKCIPKTCSSKHSVWPVVIIPAECRLLIGLLSIGFPGCQSQMKV